MCKLCELRDGIGNAFAEMANDLSETFDKFGEAMQLIERLHAKGVAFDTDEQRCYDDLRAFLGIDGTPAPAAQTMNPSELSPDFRAQIADKLSNAMGIPKESIVFCDSPEQAQAMIEKLASEGKGNKSN